MIGKMLDDFEFRRTTSLFESLSRSRCPREGRCYSNGSMSVETLNSPTNGAGRPTGGDVIPILILCSLR